jgi:L-rhamnose mutarotase
MSPRVCFKLRINPALADEYKERHAHVWPEMQDALRAAGWRNYSLFLEKDGVLTGYLECDDFATAQSLMASTDVNAKWQESMQKFFVGIEGTPDESMVPLEEVFHLD